MIMPVQLMLIFIGLALMMALGIVILDSIDQPTGSCDNANCNVNYEGSDCHNCKINFNKGQQEIKSDFVNLVPLLIVLATLLGTIPIFYRQIWSVMK